MATSITNRLLAALSADDYAQILPHLSPIDLPAKLVMHRSHEQIERCYFLDEGLASLVVEMRHEPMVEVCTVGTEGMVGVPIVLGSDRSSLRTLIQIGGRGHYMDASILQGLIATSTTLHDFLLRYAQFTFNVVAQTTACNQIHQIEQRACRWLLMIQDNIQTSTFHLTHEFLAMMLGVRRPGVTEAIGLMRSHGFIEYHRGQIRILDRGGLEARVCTCYGNVRREFDRLLALTAATDKNRRA